MTNGSTLFVTFALLYTGEDKVKLSLKLLFKARKPSTLGENPPSTPPQIGDKY